MKRLFIALEIPEKEKEVLNKVSNEIAKSLHGTFVDKDKMHVTVRFLGDTSIGEERIRDAIETINEGFRREIKIQGLDAFYRDGSPSVLFFRVATDLSDVNLTLSKLLGIKAEKDFHPHVTVCRLKEENNVESIKEKYSDFSLSFTSKGLTLFDSDFKSYRRIIGP